VEYEQANTILLIALLIATPFFVLFGALSDKWGRKNIMMLGMLLGVLLYRPIFQQLYEIAGTNGKEVASEAHSLATEGDIGAFIQKATVTKMFTDGSSLKTTNTKKLLTGENKTVKEVKLSGKDKWKMILLIATMVLFVTMVYGPIAAFLVEMFPTKIRYTSMSLPYHIGNGVFGGLVPFIATLITTLPGSNHLSGLWYPIGVACLSLVIGGLYLSNKIDKDVTD
jgi:MHS family proline/betaine transporter-like MFS transporter